MASGSRPSSWRTSYSSSTKVFLTNQKMKKNANSLILSENVALAPYRKEHVEQYHNWMSDAMLLHLTGSEPLTLDEEYQNQISWATDECKLTFILLDTHGDAQLTRIGPLHIQNIGGMMGDTNLFITNDIAEVSIMIAEKSSRGKGLGRDAAILTIAYAYSELGIRKFITKIGFENIPSLKLFEKLGFVQTSSSEVFQEITLQLPEKALNHLLSQVPPFTIIAYD